MVWWIYAWMVLTGVTLGLLVLLLVALRVNVRYKLEQAGSMSDPDFASTLQGLTNSPSRSVTALKLYTQVPEIYAGMLEAIRSARSSVTFETYLFWSGHMAEAFVDACVERARAGVEVKLLLDADGTRFLKRRT